LAPAERTLERRWRFARRPDLAATLALLRRSSADPTMAVTPTGVWRAVTTPDGPGTVRLSVEAGELVSRAWGPGAHWLTESVPGLVGRHGGSADPAELDLTGQPLLAEVRRRHPGLRLPRTGLVMDALVPGCLEQRVTGREAWRAWRQLVARYGTPAPAPSGAPPLRIAPTPVRLLEVPPWDWHRFGVDPRRYQAIRAAATVARRLEETVAFSGDQKPDVAAAGLVEARRRLRLVPGVGEWTAAEVALRAYGDPDAVSVGDFHLKDLVGFALAGRARSDDATMLELLAPWAGRRALVVRLIELSGVRPPKFGPRFSPNDIRRI
jgi:3-methyladenine DNA glycosylase/8-oxoguanine DNA glycosylase